MTKVCTLHYVAPEVLTSTSGYTEKVDVWSFGVLLFVMIAGVPPFNMERDIDTLQAVKSGKFVYEPDARWGLVAEDTKSLVAAMIVVEPSERSGIDGVMNHAAMLRTDVEMQNHQKASEQRGSFLKERRSVIAREAAVTQLRIITAVLAEKITDQQLEDLYTFLRSMDKQRTGEIEGSDFGPWLKILFESIEGGDELRDEINSLHGKIHYKMYVAQLEDRRRYVRRQAASAIFAMFDIDTNGKVSLYEISQTLEKYTTMDKASLPKKAGISPDEVHRIWEEVKSVYGGSVQRMTSKDADQNQGHRRARASRAQLLELEVKELNFDEFFQYLPMSNLGITLDTDGSRK